MFLCSIGSYIAQGHELFTIPSNPQISFQSKLDSLVVVKQGITTIKWCIGVYSYIYNHIYLKSKTF